jgi:hypothetical protein
VHDELVLVEVGVEPAAPNQFDMASRSTNDRARTPG